MSQVKSIKRWFYIHRWTSLISTLFLLVFCITGLPLIFEDEIEQWLSHSETYEVMPANTPRANLDPMVEVAQKRYPKEVVSYVFIDDTQPQVQVNMFPHYGASPDLSHSLKFDARSGKLLKDSPPKIAEEGFTDLMLSVHKSLMLGLPGELFLALIGLIFLVSIISGVYLYAPFMKNLDFGIIRTQRSKRLKWLDLHNLLGIATVIWLTVVGITGIMNELSTPLFGIWQAKEVRSLLKGSEEEKITIQKGLSSVEKAFHTAQQAVPNNIITSIVFPGHAFSSPTGYLIWTKGNQPFTAQLFNPVLVDARNGKLVGQVKMPWYLRTLEVSRPLHFGDYGGLPLKVIWAVFDIAAIVVLISGIYLWFARRKIYDAYFTGTIHEKNG